MRGAAVLRGAALAAAAALLLPATGAEAADAFDGRAPVDAAFFAAQVSDICLDALPDLEGVAADLDARGFGAPDAAGFRLHDERAVVAMAATAAELPPDAAPTCMIMAPGVAFEDAEAALAEQLEGRFAGLEPAESAALDLRHRVWLWPQGDGTARLVLTPDGQGHLGAVLALPPAGGGS